MVINARLSHGRAQQALHSFGRRMGGFETLMTVALGLRRKTPSSAVSGIATEARMQTQASRS